MVIYVFHAVTGNSEGSRNGNVDQSGNDNTNGDGDGYHDHNHYASISDANANGNANGHGKDDVAIARTIIMVERSLNDCRKTKT